MRLNAPLGDAAGRNTPGWRRLLHSLNTALRTARVFWFSRGSYALPHSEAGREWAGRLESSADMATSDRKIWLDGELVPWADATVHVLSHSLQRGSLVFDYMSVHECAGGPAIFRLDEHVERFLQSCQLTGLEVGRDASEIRAAIGVAVRANPGATAIKVSGYLASIEIDVVPVDTHVTLAIAAYDPASDVAADKPVQVKRRSSVRLWIEKDIKNRRADIVPPQAKTAANYASPMVAKARARANGYDEILLIDEFGNVAEVPTTNIFMVDAEGALRTPSIERVLLGVTRAAILEIAEHQGIEVREVEIRPEELMAAAEVFLTGTTAGVLPVESIDGQRIGSSVPGPVSAKLREHFSRISAGEDATFAHWLTPVDAI
jgi:branched-chain amino acid aminotransferase